MTIPEITFDPLYGQRQVSGSAPDGDVIIAYVDNDLDHHEYGCIETTAASGRFSAVVGSQPYTGIDEFHLVHHDGQGGYFTQARSNRYMIVSKDDPGTWLSGAIEQPGKQVTVTQMRDGSPLITYSFMSDSLNGTFSGVQSRDIPFQQGDRLVMETEGVPTFEMEIPQLDASIDIAGNQVVGHATNSRSVLADIIRTYDGISQVYKRIQVYPDAQGNFSAPLPELKDSSTCRVFPVNSCLQVALYSYSPDGNLVGWMGPGTILVSADAYEPDDTRAVAGLYTNQPQARTILASGEEDWVKFEVSPLEVGRSFTIALSQMGWKMGLNYEVYYADKPGYFKYGSFWEGGYK